MQTKTKTRTILSVPVSPEQRKELERRAGRQPLSAYARKTLFPANDNNEAPKKIKRASISREESMALASVLALLGPVRSALTNIAYGIASGILPFTPDTEAAILKACNDIAEMKALVMKAIGIRER